MTLSVTIISLITLAAFVAPIILVTRGRKRKLQQHIDELKVQASQLNLTLSEIDNWQDYMMGIDAEKHELLFVNINDHEHLTCIDLHNVKRVKSIPDKVVSDIKKERRLGLVIIFKEATAKDMSIDFYISGFGSMTNNDILRFQRWKQIIASNLETANSLNKVSYNN